MSSWPLFQISHFVRVRSHPTYGPGRIEVQFNSRKIIPGNDNPAWVEIWTVPYREVVVVVSVVEDVASWNWSDVRVLHEFDSWLKTDIEVTMNKVVFYAWPGSDKIGLIAKKSEVRHTPVQTRFPNFHSALEATTIAANNHFFSPLELLAQGLNDVHDDATR